MTNEELLTRRHKILDKNSPPFYDQPLQWVRGEGVSVPDSSEDLEGVAQEDLADAYADPVKAAIEAVYERQRPAVAGNTGRGLRRTVITAF